jgi:hypothetical protein
MTGPAASEPLQRCRITVDPVVAAAREQVHGRAVPAHDQPIAVVLDLVHPAGPGGRLVSKGRDAGAKNPSVRLWRASMLAQIAAGHRVVKSPECRGVGRREAELKDTRRRNDA